MNEERRTKILTMFTSCPLVSTENVAAFFQSNANPSKRASWALKQLEEEKLVEGKSRRLGETKLWRLTTKGRKELPGACRAVSFSTAKDEHYIALCSVWFHLQSLGELIRWAQEPRYPFGEKKVNRRGKLVQESYGPDAFFTLREKGKTHFGFVEVQLTPQTETRWAEKWKVASTFFDSPEFGRAAFQDFKNSKGEAITIPSTRFHILVVSNQQVDTVRAGSRLPLIITKDIKQAPLV